MQRQLGEITALHNRPEKRWRCGNGRAWILLIARQRTLRDGSPSPSPPPRRGEARREGDRFFFSGLSTKLFLRNRRNIAATNFSHRFVRARKTNFSKEFHLPSKTKSRMIDIGILGYSRLFIVRIVVYNSNARLIESTKSRGNDACQFFPRAIYPNEFSTA